MTRASFSLGGPGEREWRRLNSAYHLSPEKNLKFITADSAEVRAELRRRLAAEAPRLERLEPSREVARQIQALTDGADDGLIVWIEAQTSEDDDGWGPAFVALNRARDLLWDHGPAFVVLAGPGASHRQMLRGAPDLSSVLGAAFMFDDTLEPLVTSSERAPLEPLCWLHLSDIHVPGYDWQLDDVRDALLRDLPGLLEHSGRKPQLVFVTGDLAARAKPEEFDGVHYFLRAVCELLELVPEERLFLVPGNHDVDRSMITGPTRRAWGGYERITDEDELRTAIGELLDSPRDLAGYGRRLTNYCSFTAKLLGPARAVAIDRPWRSDIVELGGLRVGVASMCSVWMSGPDDAKGRMVLGQRQVQQLARELASAPLRVALLHHPLAWLREEEERHVRRLLEDEFDVILHGHAHHPEARAVSTGGHGVLEIGGGAVYARLGQDRYHGFTLGWIDPSGGPTAGVAEIDAFTWTTRQGHWHRDAGYARDADMGRLRLGLKLARVGGAPRPSEAEVDAEIGEALVARLRQAVVRVHGAQGFIGLPDAAPKPAAGLHDMFVPLELRPEREGEPSPLDELEARWLQTSAEPAARVVVLGDAGSGKSTLSRYLAVQAASSEAGPVPLLIAVREWAVDGREGLLEQAALDATRVLRVATTASELEGLCEAGQVVLIVDGVDEVGPDLRAALRDRVHGFSARFGRVPVIVTSRIVGYDDAALRREEFEHLRLEPFDDRRLREFIGRWYAVAEREDPVRRERRRAELWAALEAEPRAKELARNPLLATLLALVHFHRAQLPGDRAELYGLCVETLLVTWPAACKRELVEFPGRQQQPALEELALWMQSRRPDEENRADRERGVVLTGAELEAKLDELLARHRGELGLGRRLELRDRWRRWLLAASGLIQEQQADRYAFLHLSLLEHLAGQAALRQCFASAPA